MPLVGADKSQRFSSTPHQQIVLLHYMNVTELVPQCNILWNGNSTGL